MKKAVFCILFSIIFTFAVSAQQNPSITIVNDTGYEVWYVYVSPSTDDMWGDDVLDPTQVLQDGESVTVKLQFPLNQVSKYDIMLEDSDGDTYSKFEVTVRNNSRIVFTFDDIDWD